MPLVSASDGVKLFYESAGVGQPVVFIHELSGSHRSFDPQLRALKSRYRCIAYNARGYPPSDVPESVDAYAQDIAAADIAAVLDGLGLDNAHLVGVSMGSAAALQLAIKSPNRVRSLVLCGIGTGSDQAPAEFMAVMETMAQDIERLGLQEFAKGFEIIPNRKSMKTHHPAAWREFLERYMEGSAKGRANTMRGVQMRRPPLYAHKEELEELDVPTLIIVGENDEPCVKPSNFLHHTIKGSKLETVEGAGHATNLEEPEIFNQLTGDFLDRVEAKRH